MKSELPFVPFWDSAVLGFWPGAPVPAAAETQFVLLQPNLFDLASNWTKNALLKVTSPPVVCVGEETLRVGKFS